MTQYHELAAHILGMKVSEITDVQRTASGQVVTTHDGQRTLITPEGQAVPLTGGELLGEHSEPVPPAETDPAADGEEVDEDPVPEGTAEEVLAWVGEDTERARLALEHEQARERPRVTLSKELERLATP
ncbi:MULTISPECIES: hypothetical protein [unclassified Crossiella]|uniref:hypothetical protein n=1 Tax=unclassified Crossiella TaxID=2620835 RepID=UPI001FFFA70E|nr:MULTISPECIES: hypothetical protein [unclassified Crossiella]MCK2242152.1 hypothetical protein [Crossiella sp. S99.2]MCK2256055.1 hypothetical protein [Crossiella sp. S99.1]